MSEFEIWRRYEVTDPHGVKFEVAQLIDKDGRLAPLVSRTTTRDWQYEDRISLADLIAPEQRFNDWDVKLIEPTTKDALKKSTTDAFSLAVKRDRLQYLRRVKTINLVPDSSKWNGNYNQATGVITLEAKFENLPFIERVQVILHEGGHHGQQIDPTTYQAYLDSGLNKLTSFVRMANCVHIKDWQERGIDPTDMTEEVFAESYSRWCLDLEMPGELRAFWDRRGSR